jgi:hypothetical protein
MVKEMIVTILVGLVIVLLLFGFMALLFPDMSYFLMSSVMTPEQVASTTTAATVTVPYYPDQINVIPIIPFVIVGFIVIMMFALVRRS